MDSVLLIAESSTLRFSLQRCFKAAPFDLTETRSYQEALNSLPGEQIFEAIIISWPTIVSDDFISLISLIESPRFAFLPVIAVSALASEKARNWIHKRSNSTLILLDQYNEIPDILTRLLNENSTVTAILETIKETRDPIHVLFIDDSRSTRDYYERLLLEHHYQVTTSDSVKHAWSLLDIDDYPAYDLIITDYFMPNENGYKLCRRIRKSPKLRHIPTAIITGAYVTDVIDHALRSGAVECMFKEEIDNLFLARVASMTRIAQDRRSIEHERQRLSNILSSVGEGVCGVDNNEKINFINPAALQILGYQSADNLINRKADQTLYNPDTSKSASRLHRASQSSEELRDWHTYFISSESKHVPVSCTIVPILISDKRTGTVIAFRDITKQLKMEQQLRWQATRDSLTKLHNRRYFEEQLETECQRLQRADETSALLYMDLDRFKYINDTAGHDTGDKVLIMVSKLLHQRVRASDTLARLGGDEFAVILRGIDISNIEQTADQFRQVLSTLSFTHNNHAIKVHGSIGVALFDKDNNSASDVMAQADIACHQAKSEGRDLTRIYDSNLNVRNEMTTDLGWASRLHNALDNDNFVLHFQPILALADIDFTKLPDTSSNIWALHQYHRDRPVYVESLIRLQNTDGKLIDPNLFLPSAERFGLMPKIDLWVMQQITDTLKIAHDLGLLYNIGVNLSALTLDDTSTLNQMISLISNMGELADHLIIEITERNAITNMLNVKKFIEKVKSFGCHLSLDDFGAGFSSFSQLRDLPVDYVKIDGQYVIDMDTDTTNRTIVTAINDIAHSIGRNSIAEYVENPDILKSLKACGVDYAQGFYISHPLTMQQLLHIHRDEPTAIMPILKIPLG